MSDIVEQVKPKIVDEIKTLIDTNCVSILRVRSVFHSHHLYEVADFFTSVDIEQYDDETTNIITQVAEEFAPAVTHFLDAKQVDVLSALTLDIESFMKTEQPKPVISKEEARAIVDQFMLKK